MDSSRQTFTCKHCEKEFIPKKANATKAPVYCSQDCCRNHLREALWRRRTGESKKAP